MKSKNNFHKRLKIGLSAMVFLAAQSIHLLATENLFAATVETIANQSGLSFPSNGQTSNDIRFKFSGATLQPMYPATYIWQVNLRRHSGYYTTFFWGPDGPFTGTGFYGAHPYPDGEPKQTSSTHKWELSIDGNDYVDDANNHPTTVEYDVWKTQALRVFDDGKNKVHEFYWDLPDTTKVIRKLLGREYGATAPINPALTFGDAPWSLGAERLSGILRGLQLYATALTPPDILTEIKIPLSTASGKSGIWYLNSNPTPEDISDKSGKGHNPEWISSFRPALWGGTGTTISLVPLEKKTTSGDFSQLLRVTPKGQVIEKGNNTPWLYWNPKTKR